MAFDSLNLSPKETHELQPSLKKVLQKISGQFETKISMLGELDYKGPAALRYLGMEIDQLIKLHVVVGDLRSDLERVKNNFVLDEKTRKVLDEIRQAAEIVIHSDEEMDFIKKWEESGEDSRIKIDEELANTLGNQIHNIEENIDKLKELNAV